MLLLLLPAVLPAVLQPQPWQRVVSAGGSCVLCHLITHAQHHQHDFILGRDASSHTTWVLQTVANLLGLVGNSSMAQEVSTSTLAGPILNSDLVTGHHTLLAVWGHMIWLVSDL